MFDDLPPDLERLRTLRVWHALWLNRIDRKIALLERREAEAEHGRKNRPRPPEWVVEVGIGTSKPPVQVHAGTCHMIGSRRRPVSRAEARRLLADGLRACTHCQPDTQLHIIDLAARESTCAPSTTSPAPSPMTSDPGDRGRCAVHTGERTSMPGSVRAVHPTLPHSSTPPRELAKRPQRGCQHPDQTCTLC
ncbi:DUF6233 domain-containing protein [Streptomyces doebereineriae]|uniref:DUF6233 domain-containing protein n=1 Tax=Streptomyces doebereineriae TaxID=3075528 RepID=A0ABU2V360_9ACTN|nr:DUF6233 domain-containing protein [Streptomyces sp. DSM 41640]MDT0479611.1 DUF6233 domain-containing protein [Streptomyces sp. DSM 41640]